MPVIIPAERAARRQACGRVGDGTGKIQLDEPGRAHCRLAAGVRVHGHVEGVSSCTPACLASINSEVERRALTANHWHCKGELVQGVAGHDLAEVEADRGALRQGDAVREIGATPRFVRAQDDPRSGSTVAELRESRQETRVEGLDQRKQGERGCGSRETTESAVDCASGDGGPSKTLRSSERYDATLSERKRQECSRSSANWNCKSEISASLAAKCSLCKTSLTGGGSASPEGTGEEPTEQRWSDRADEADRGSGRESEGEVGAGGPGPARADLASARSRRRLSII